MTLINREDAIDELRRLIPYKKYHRGEWVYLLDKREVFKAINALPSAEAEWIPCSERLPSMRTEVIYSFDGIVSTGYMTDRDFNGEKMELHWEDLECGATIEPIAWMPLPKPYKGGDTE